MTRKLLQEVVEFEAQAFAAGQLARHLAAKHSRIPTQNIRLSSGTAVAHVSLRIWPQSPDALRRWAKVLDCKVTAEFRTPIWATTEEVEEVYLTAETTVGSVEVGLWFISQDAEEIARYRADGDES